MQQLFQMSGTQRRWAGREQKFSLSQSHSNIAANIGVHLAKCTGVQDKLETTRLSVVFQLKHVAIILMYI